jgi:hypothetical protein
MAGEDGHPWEVCLRLRSLKSGHPQGTAQWAGMAPVAFAGWLELAHLLELSEPRPDNDISTSAEQIQQPSVVRPGCFEETK